MISPRNPDLRPKITELSIDSEKQEPNNDGVKIIVEDINQEFLKENVDFSFECKEQT